MVHISDGELGAVRSQTTHHSLHIPRLTRVSPSDPDPPGLGGLEEAPGLAGGTPRREVRRLGPPAGRQTHQTVWEPPHGGRHQDLLVRHDTSSKPQSLGGGGMSENITGRTRWDGQCNFLCMRKCLHWNCYSIRLHPPRSLICAPLKFQSVT